MGKGYVQIGKKGYNNNKSGQPGVSFDKEKNKWKAKMMRNKKSIHLGYFLTKEEAIEAKQKADNSSTPEELHIPRETRKVVINGVEYISVNEACRQLGLSRYLVSMRLHRGWSIEEAFSAKKFAPNKWGEKIEIS